VPAGRRLATLMIRCTTGRVRRERDGTWTARCRCGWTTSGFLSERFARQALARHRLASRAWAELAEAHR